VVGVLRGRSKEFVVIGAHHDTAPDAPGAYDDGGGVGVLIETSKLFAKDKERPRTLVFASFDGEEAWSTGKATVTGSRAYVKSLGADARDLVGAFVIEMCGFKDGTPAFQALAYQNPREGGSVIAPRYLVAAAARGAREAGLPFAFGDPYIPWLHQAAVRVFRAGYYGDDLAFLQAGLPAVFVSDSSFTRFYPDYHLPSDTPDKLDPLALERMGRAVTGALRALETTERGPDEPHWFSAFGVMLGPLPLLAIGILSVLPGLRLAVRAGGRARSARLLQALLFGFLLYRHPVPALFVLLLPNLLPLAPRRMLSLAIAAAPALLLAGLGLVAWQREFVSGTFLSAWDQVAAALAFAHAFVPLGGSAPPPMRAGGKPKGRKAGLKGR
jgi:hypothetical protein